jgi:DNA polymerase-4
MDANMFQGDSANHFAPLPYYITPMRKIIHIDMDAFYASVEQRDNPDLQGKPVAVGRGELRGVVAAASYEARPYGVRSAMPSVTAKRLCPELIFVKHRFDVYRAISRQIREIFLEYTDLVEPLSLDEAYLDVTENRKGIPSGTIIAEEIRREIKRQTQLTASAGVSYNKFLAKLASDMDKPDGLFVIEPKQADRILRDLPIERFHGIGPATAKRMHAMGIKTGADLRSHDEHELVRIFGKAGRYYYRIARGQDDRDVQPTRIRKSIGAERTYLKDLRTPQEMEAKLAELTDIEWERIEKHAARGWTVTLKIKYHDFVIRSRSVTAEHPVGSREELWGAALGLLYNPAPPERPVRLLGLTLSNLETGEGDDPGQLSMDFGEE